MKEYTLFTLNLSGVIDTAHRSRFASDMQALDHARRVAGDKVVEVWSGRDKVARVLPQGGETRVA